MFKLLYRWLVIQWDKSKGSQHELMIFKSLKGKFYVTYKQDNKRSVNMDYYCACNYAELFKGDVYHVKYGFIKSVINK